MSRNVLSPNVASELAELRASQDTLMRLRKANDELEEKLQLETQNITDLEGQRGGLRRRVAELEQLLKVANDNLATLRSQVAAGSESADHRIKMREWIADRDAFRRQIELLADAEHQNMVLARLERMRLNASRAEDYEMAVAILEESKRLLNDVRSRAIARLDKLKRVGFSNIQNGVDDIDRHLRRIDEDLVKTEVRFHGAPIKANDSTE